MFFKKNQEAGEKVKKELRGLNVVIEKRNDGLLTGVVEEDNRVLLEEFKDYIRFAELLTKVRSIELVDCAELAIKVSELSRGDFDKDIPTFYDGAELASKLQKRTFKLEKFLRAMQEDLDGANLFVGLIEDNLEDSVVTGEVASYMAELIQNIYDKDEEFGKYLDSKIAPIYEKVIAVADKPSCPMKYKMFFGEEDEFNL